MRSALFRTDQLQLVKRAGPIPSLILGDKVRLASGGPSMRVTAIANEKAECEHALRSARLGQVRRYTFPIACLILVDALN